MMGVPVKIAPVNAPLNAPFKLPDAIAPPTNPAAAPAPIYAPAVNYDGCPCKNKAAILKPRSKYEIEVIQHLLVLFRILKPKGQPRTKL
jgi:hypothetical protein